MQNFYAAIFISISKNLNSSSLLILACIFSFGGSFLKKRILSSIAIRFSSVVFTQKSALISCLSFSVEIQRVCKTVSVTSIGLLGFSYICTIQSFIAFISQDVTRHQPKLILAFQDSLSISIFLITSQFLFIF